MTEKGPQPNVPPPAYDTVNDGASAFNASYPANQSQPPPLGQPGSYPPLQQPLFYGGGPIPRQGQAGMASAVVITQPTPTTYFVHTEAYESDWMMPAIFACVFCFWPTGIFAIIAANNASRAAASGDTALAENWIKKTRNLTLLTVTLGLITFITLAVLRSSIVLHKPPLPTAST